MIVLKKFYAVFTIPIVNMDLLRSYFFKNEPLMSLPFLSSKLDSAVNIFNVIV